MERPRGLQNHGRQRADDRREGEVGQAAPRRRHGVGTVDQIAYDRSGTRRRDDIAQAISGDEARQRQVRGSETGAEKSGQRRRDDKQSQCGVAKMQIGNRPSGRKGHGGQEYGGDRNRSAVEGRNAGDRGSHRQQGENGHARAENHRQDAQKRSVRFRRTNKTIADTRIGPHAPQAAAIAPARPLRQVPTR